VKAGAARPAEFGPAAGARQEAARDETRPADEATGEVVVLVARGEDVDSFPGLLEARAAEGPSVHVETHTGKLELFPGTWHLVAEGARLSESNVNISAASRAVIWAWSAKPWVVRVLESDGAQPISGARIQWRAATGSEVHELESDPTGEALFTGTEALGCPAGRFKIWAPGYAQRTVDQLPTNGDHELVVLLEPLPPDLAPLGGLRVFDQASARSLAGARLTQAPLNPANTSDNSGHLAVPGWLDPYHHVEVALAGYFPRRAFLNQLLEAGGEVPMAHSVPVQVLPGLSGKGTLRVFALGDGGAELDSRSLHWDLGPPLPFDAGIPVTLPLPEGDWVHFSATDERGHWALLDWQVVASAAPVSLDSSDEAQGQVLVLDVTDTRRQQLTSASASAYVRGLGELEILPDADGRFRIAHADEVESIEVRSAGTPRVNLSRVHFYDKPTPPAGGHLEVVAEDSFDVPVALVDASGQPLAGLSISLDSNIGLVNSQKYPKLDGDLPSEHPAWSIGLPPAPKGTSDADGRLVLPRVRPGDYELNAHLPSARAGSYLTPYAAPAVPITVTSSAALTVTVTRPHLIRFTVLDSSTNTPLPTAALIDVARPFARSFTQAATPWTGWLAASSGPFRISAPGHRPLEVSLEELEGSPSLLLWPDAGVLVKLTGSKELLTNLEGHVIRVRHLSRTSPGTGDMRPTTRISTTTIRSGAFHLDSVIDEEFVLEPLELGGEQITFEPSHLTWHGESELYTESGSLLPLSDS
jgi:hypothetical protein